MRGQISNFGNLINLFNITAVKMAREINVAPSYISKWKRGNRPIPIDAPYFNQIIDYFISKNESIGGGLLEDFFARQNPDKRPLNRDDLKKSIRNYILEVTEKITEDSAMGKLMKYADAYMTVARYDGAAGRFDMVMALLEEAEKSSTPAVIKIFEVGQFSWIERNMHYTVTLYKKLKSVLIMGHTIEVILQLGESDSINWGMHQVFMELMFQENMRIYVYQHIGKTYTSSIYILSGKLVVTGHNFDSDFNNLNSYLYSDMKYADIQERIWGKYKLISTQLFIYSKTSEFEKILQSAKAFNSRTERCCHLGKALSIATMSKTLLDEILIANHVTAERKKLCYAFYNLFRENMENSQPSDMSGFYYILDELTAPLTFPIITNYTLSALAGKLVQMTREQYLRHFRDTAELLLQNKNYRVLLYNAPPSSIIPSYVQQSIWFKDECWTLYLGIDDVFGKPKIQYVDNFRITNIFSIGFMEIFARIPEHHRDNSLIAELFMKIADEAIGYSCRI